MATILPDADGWPEAGEITITEAAALLGITRQSAHELATRGTLPGVRRRLPSQPRPVIYLDRAAVEAYQRRRQA